MKEVAVFVTWVEPMADMAVDLLRAEGIPVRKSSYQPELTEYIGGGFGEIEILVPEPEAPRALEILSVRFSEAEEEGGMDEENEDGEETEGDDEDSGSR